MHNSTPRSLCPYYISPLSHLTVHRSPLIASKGKNTGFKNFNPARPCRRCWYQHSRPYAGALVYTPWSNNINASSSSNSGTNLQRPLPNFRPRQQQQQQIARAITSQMHGPYRHLLRAISSPDLSPSRNQTQRRPRQQPALPSPPLLIHLTLQPTPMPRSPPAIHLGDPSIGGRCIGSAIVPFFMSNFGETVNQRQVTFARRRSHRN